MSIQLQPSVPLMSLVKTEPPTVIKNEPPEEELEKEISPDTKDIDIVYHSLSEDLIKNETVPENLFETKYSESVETQVLVKTEDTIDENVTTGTEQEVIEAQGSREHSNTLSNLETYEQLVLNSSNETNSWDKEKEKIKIIRACDPVESHEYTSLAEYEYVCKHCQHAYNTSSSLEYHIRKMHREVTTMYQCPYCPYKSKWHLQRHINQKHKHIKDIQWFQCNLCEMKFKVKADLTRHMKVQLKHTQMKNGLDLPEKRYHCDSCDHKTYTSTLLKNHKIIHLKPKEIEYFYCSHCSYKSKKMEFLKRHIFTHFKNVKKGKRYGCNKCYFETYTSTQFKRHNLVHLKPEEIEYFYCYHCSYKAKQKVTLKRHIFSHHFKNVKQGKKYHCDSCDHKTYTSTLLKNHKIIHLKPKEIEYFYCSHCSYKSKKMEFLKRHIFTHFKNVKKGKRYGCNKCDFETYTSTQFKRHNLVHLKPEEIEYFYCYHCSYKAKQKVTLKRHIFSHRFKNVKQGKK